MPDIQKENKSNDWYLHSEIQIYWQHFVIKLCKLFQSSWYRTYWTVFHL